MNTSDKIAAMAAEIYQRDVPTEGPIKECFDRSLAAAEAFYDYLEDALQRLRQRDHLGDAD